MARNSYQYSTSPRKLEPEIKRKKQQQKGKLKIIENQQKEPVRISNEQKKKQTKVTLIVMAIFILLLTISYRTSQINESFNNVQTLKRELSTLKKENEQLKVSIENNVNLNNIEKLAKEKLGMQKLTNKQTIYISLPKKDFTESPSEEMVKEEKNWFKKIIDKIFNE